VADVEALFREPQTHSKTHSKTRFSTPQTHIRSYEIPRDGKRGTRKSIVWRKQKQKSIAMNKRNK
jgi:hypothetical protein